MNGEEESRISSLEKHRRQTGVGAGCTGTTKKDSWQEGIDGELGSPRVKEEARLVVRDTVGFFKERSDMKKAGKCILISQYCIGPIQ